MYFLTSILYSIQALFVAAYSAFNGALIVLSSVIIGLMSIAGLLALTGIGIPVAIGVVIVALVFFVLFMVIAVMALIYHQFLLSVFKVNTLAPIKGPDKPSLTGCFSGDTKIQTMGGWPSIKSLQPGVQLKSGGHVTAVMECLLTDDLYQIGNIQVTGNHPVFYKRKNKWVSSKYHPDAVKIKDMPYLVYCLSTSNKQIKIGEYIFSDWDELDEQDILEITQKTGLKPKMMHKLERGFKKNTLVKMHGGESALISNIKPGDLLYGNITVQSIVHSHTEIPCSTIIDLPSIQGTNIVVETNDRLFKHSSDYKSKSSKKTLIITHIYHLVTNTGRIPLVIDNDNKGTVSCYDYNLSVEYFIFGDIKTKLLNQELFSSPSMV